MVSAWFSEVPDVAVAPVILPVLVPNVQANVLAGLAVNARAGLAPLQTLAVVAFVKEGL